MKHENHSVDGDRNEEMNEEMNEKVELLYLVLVCDGVWDVMTNDEVENFIVNKVNKKQNKRNIHLHMKDKEGDDFKNQCTNDILLPEVSDELL